jgi:hypothetical protein
MNLPKKVNILGLPYKVMYAKNCLDVDILGQEQLLGQCDSVTCTIRILDDGGRTPESMFDVLLHEVIHAIFDRLGMVGENKDHTELIVNQLGVAITDFLLRNKFVELK